MKCFLLRLPAWLTGVKLPKRKPLLFGLYVDHCHDCGHPFRPGDPLMWSDAGGVSYCRDHVPRTHLDTK